jgi:NAD(P)-dependent dehydrogenase (short-subunit alcohol dehydrogenase family)
MTDTAEWAGQCAVVTGAAGGIGRATVTALLAEGARVVAFDASAAGLETATATWAAGERVRTVVGDVGAADDVARAFAAVEPMGRPLAALVACAGIYSSAPVDELSDDEWYRVLRVNLRGTFLCCRAAARAMVPQRAGAIVTMASSIAYHGLPGRAHYAASKGGVAAFTKSLALELAPHGIRANALAPGSIDTAMPRQLAGRTEAQVQKTLRENPLGRVGTPDDVAELILFLLSRHSSHITGQVIHINAGQWTY